MSNATRGCLAEFIVARALGVDAGAVRDEWGAYDLQTPSGIRIEVKSAGFLQTWFQRRLSAIVFKTPPTQAWDPEANDQSKESKRQADVYVFALHAHQDKATVDPLNLEQWRFYVVATPDLDARIQSQQSITLTRTIHKPWAMVQEQGVG